MKGINMYIAMRIHNNSLGKCVYCPEGQEQAKELVKGWASDQLGRPLEDSELDEIENNLEIYNEDDADNMWCYVVGVAEEAE